MHHKNDDGLAKNEELCRAIARYVFDMREQDAHRNHYARMSYPIS